MGKAVLTMHASLDGIVTGEERWMTMSDEILGEYLGYYDGVDRIVVGSRTYAELAGYWQNAERSSASGIEREIARKINDIPKLVLSRSPQDLVWRNSEQLRFEDDDSLIRQIQALKNAVGTVSVESGLQTWRFFLRHGLYDDLWMFVHPAIAAQGERLFDGLDHTHALRLASSKTYGNGAIGLYYRRNESERLV
ncbi:dihydrofolate reductase family protein [Cohnella xylanilytica]|uniref:Dihydrofolate reductase family protein n=1 Tax=Cohnella xylanilytica TaxID=557555 RepID=A0A841U626_9BACL|nr:dihydrofolate reductase family protein [Cohnella xylanilytica]MBB6695249.1 dihydrofolate reductase family protein [Cohnella xylanilytica]